MTKAITPQEAREKEGSYIPDFVIECFNECIIENLRGKEATVYQKDAVKKIKDRIPPENQYSNEWLNIEPIFRHAGWKVSYDKPGYNESYDAFFVFKIEDK